MPANGFLYQSLGGWCLSWPQMDMSKNRTITKNLMVNHNSSHLDPFMTIFQGLISLIPYFQTWPNGWLRGWLIATPWAAIETETPPKIISSSVSNEEILPHLLFCDSKPFHCSLRRVHFALTVLVLTLHGGLTMRIWRLWPLDFSKNQEHHGTTDCWCNFGSSASNIWIFGVHSFLTRNPYGHRCPEPLGFLIHVGPWWWIDQVNENHPM